MCSGHDDTNNPELADGESGDPDPGERPSKPTGRKSIVKLSRKQKQRRMKKMERGEHTIDRATAKKKRDGSRLEKKLRAKALW